MDITIRHLSGSMAGQERTFSASRVTLGRNPVNDIAFDPHQDSVVSGQHAELTSRHDGWFLRDVGSSNGTFINEERVTERLVRPGEVVQLGKNGPRLQINYDLPQGAHLSPPAVSDAPVEGRTVMMMMNEGVPATAGPAGFASAPHTPPAFTPAAPAKKKGGLLKALLVVILLFGFLMVAGLVAYVFLAGGDSTEAATTATTTDTSTASATETAAMETAAATMTGTGSTATGTAMTSTQAGQTSTAQTSTAGTTTATTTVATTTTPAQTETSSGPKTITELEQQLARSQQLIDGLQRELQQKNDTLKKTESERDSAIGQRNAALRRAREAEARARAAQAQPQSYVLPRRAKPVQVAGLLSSSMLMSLAMQAEDSGEAAGQGLSKSKYLKKRISYVYEEPEIPLPEMPEDMPSAIGGLVIQALGSTGRYIAAESDSDAGISVVVTNYNSDVRTRVNTEAVTNAVGAISSIFGGPSVDSPVDTKSISMNADMTARVKLYDPNSVELAAVYAEAASKGRKTSADIAGLAVNEIANTETALGDVTRKIAADAVDSLLPELDNVVWQAWITEADSEKKTVTVNCGTRCQIEAGDVFGIYDGEDRLGTAKVSRVTPDAAYARVTEGEGEFVSLWVRYEGRAGDSPLTRKSQQKRTLKTRNAVQAYSGPGTTFGEVRKLSAGAELNFLYSVGTWAKVSDGSASFWIPLSSAQITG